MASTWPPCSPHRAALASDWPTIAILAGGVDRPYPTGHRDLLSRIARNGLVLSETPPGTTPTRWRFIQRGRIMAALSGATVIVEAAYRSGSLGVAWNAAELGRPAGAVPGPVTSVTSAGTHRLLHEGTATLVTDTSDVTALLDSPTPRWSSPTLDHDNLHAAPHGLHSSRKRRSEVSSMRVGHDGLNALGANTATCFLPRRRAADRSGPDSNGPPASS